MATKEIEDLYTALTTPYIQGVCKDCGNATLNNELNPAFEPQAFYRPIHSLDTTERLVCLACGSDHLDIL